jgi:hypothetical protein
MRTIRVIGGGSLAGKIFYASYESLYSRFGDEFREDEKFWFLDEPIVNDEGNSVKDFNIEFHNDGTVHHSSYSNDDIVFGLYEGELYVDPNDLKTLLQIQNQNILEIIKMNDKIRYVFCVGVKEVILFDENENCKDELTRFFNRRVVQLTKEILATKNYTLNIIGNIPELRLPKISLHMGGQTYEGYMPWGLDSITIDVDEDLLDGRFNKC